MDERGGSVDAIYNQSQNPSYQQLGFCFLQIVTQEATTYVTPMRIIRCEIGVAVLTREVKDGEAMMLIGRSRTSGFRDCCRRVFPSSVAFLPLFPLSSLHEAHA